MIGIRTRTGLTLIACLICATARAQDATVVADLKAQLDFDSWPGTTGPAKQGLRFDPADYPGLLGFSIVSDRLVLDYQNYGLIRNVTLTNGVGSLTLRIGVGAGTAVNGHELFLRSGPADSDFPYAQGRVRGDLGGSIPIGDLNFVNFGATLSELGGYIGFMRNNVFCEIADDSDNPSGVDLVALVTQLDAAIIALPSVSPSQFESQRPVVSLSPATTTLSSRTIGSTTAIVSVGDPTLVSGPLTRRFASNDVNVQDPGGSTIVITASSTIGSVPLEMVVANAFLQFGTATVVFNITP